MSTRIENALDARRLELGMTWRAIWQRAGISVETLRQLRMGEPVNALTDARVEAALAWAPGSIATIREGGTPTPHAPTADSHSTPDVVRHLFQVMGLTYQSPRECIGFLAEEVGELAKATRTGGRQNLAEEVGDVGILLHRIAALYGIDVDAAVREKAAERLERHRAEVGQ